MNATFKVWPVNSSFWTDFDRSGRCGRNNKQSVCVCVLLEINMSNNCNVSKYRGLVRRDLPENAFSVFLEKTTATRPFLIIIL